MDTPQSSSPHHRYPLPAATPAASYPWRRHPKQFSTHSAQSAATHQLVPIACTPHTQATEIIHLSKNQPPPYQALFYRTHAIPQSPEEFSLQGSSLASHPPQGWELPSTSTATTTPPQNQTELEAISGRVLWTRAQQGVSYPGFTCRGGVQIDWGTREQGGGLCFTWRQ